MNDEITTDNILRLASIAQIELTPEEEGAVRAHLQRQAEVFKVLDCINTDGITPISCGDTAIVTRRAK